MFFDNKIGFIYKNNILVKTIYDLIPISAKFTIIIFLAMHLYIFVKYFIKHSMPKERLIFIKLLFIIFISLKFPSLFIIILFIILLLTLYSQFHLFSRQTISKANYNKNSNHNSNIISNKIFTEFFTKIFTEFLNKIIYGYLKIIIKKPVFWMMIALIIGPGLIVNYIGKEYFGRARPHEIKEFGGNKIFSRPFIITDQCETNCSFPSGHAAFGFYLTIFAYFLAQKNTSKSLKLYNFNEYFLIMFSFGLISSIDRIIMGGHFTSDVISSGFFVMLTNHICYHLYLKYNQ